MNPIYDSRGSVVAWLDNNVVRDTHGRAVALVDGDHVFTYDRHTVGHFSDGFFRDREGHAVAFIKGARGGPILPITQITPISPVGNIAPVAPISPISPIAPIGRLTWSSQDWTSFIRGT